MCSDKQVGKSENQTTSNPLIFFLDVAKSVNWRVQVLSVKSLDVSAHRN